MANGFVALSAKSARRARAAETFRVASECIGRIERGSALFAVTRGQFSLIDALLVVLDQVGPSFVSIWTWAASEHEVETLDRLRQDGRVTGARLVLDYNIRQKPIGQGLIRQWRQSYGAEAIRWVMNHAKMATVESESGYRVLMRGSFNLNCNPRFEQFDLTEGGEDFDLVRRIELELPVLEADAPGAEVYAASGLNEAFPFGRFQRFDGAPVWEK